MTGSLSSTATVTTPQVSHSLQQHLACIGKKGRSKKKGVEGEGGEEEGRRREISVMLGRVRW
jgi:hypothetical protein